MAMPRKAANQVMDGRTRFLFGNGADLECFADQKLDSVA